jgi:tRNA threonylcarbamoyl adenosine modification protein (Sua5/YciO/YrdC/YwlC family)
MKTVSIDEFLSDDGIRKEAAAILRDKDGLVCFPCAATYRIAASVQSERAVLSLLQAKRRAKHAHALVMVSDQQMLSGLVEPLSDQLQRMIGNLWPGNVTLRLRLGDTLPRKVYRELSKPDKKIGVRLPHAEIAERLVAEVGVPLLVSSANRSRKAGAASVAAIKKNFHSSISLFIDAGDLPQRPPSTIVDFDDDGRPRVVRKGAVEGETIQRAWVAAASS